MKTRLAPKTALATLAAVGLLLPFGTPLPGSCMRTVGVAGAAPSPSCGGDLRECLRAAADTHTTTFGARYVTADDVARCMEAFRSCISGGASRGGSAGAPTTPSKNREGKGALPEHFGIMYEESLAIDCRVNGDAVTCTDAATPLPATMDSRTGQVTGTLSGLTMTGTRTIRTQAHYTAVPGCIEVGEGSGPVTYVFSVDGTVDMSEGPISWRTTRSGDCSGGESRTSPATKGTATWSALS